MERFTVLDGDCLPHLKALPDDSVDAFVSDIPYGLSAEPDITDVLTEWIAGRPYYGPLKKGHKHCAARIVRDSVVLQSNDGISEVESDQFVPFRISFDRMMMQFRSIEFNNQKMVWKEEVTGKPTLTGVNHELMNKVNTESNQHNLNGQFCLRMLETPSACVGVCTHFSQTSETIFRIGIRFCYNTSSSTAGTTVVMADGATEVRAVLSLDITNSTGEILPAGATDQIFPFTFEQFCTEQVGTRSGAGGLSPDLQTSWICGINNEANRTDTINECVLLVHKDLIERMRFWWFSVSGFMEESWDSFVPGPEIWREVFRVLKPGAHALSFGGCRTFDLVSIAMRIAGFERRDTISHDTVLRWVYGTGKPWNQDVSKFIDKTQGATREKKRIEGRAGATTVRGQRAVRFRNPKVIGDGVGVKGGDRPWMIKADEVGFHETDGDIPVTPEAQEWQGWGSALKPAWEPILVCRKPLSEETLAKNILKHGAGGLNVEECHIGNLPGGWGGANGFENTHQASKHGGLGAGEARPSVGKWPANQILSHHPDCDDTCMVDCPVFRLQARQAEFFYTAKPLRQEKDAGIISEPIKRNRVNRGGIENDPKWAPQERLNPHTTVKPVSLMKFLIALVTKPGGLVLDPYCGSGTTGVAAMELGMRFLGMELRPEHAEIARQRISWAAGQPMKPLRERSQNVQESLFDMLDEEETT